MDKPRVRFLCNANSARSLMGEALLRHQAGDRFEAVSAGNEPDEPHWDIHEPRLIERKDAYEQALAERCLRAGPGRNTPAVVVVAGKQGKGRRQTLRAAHRDPFFLFLGRLLSTTSG